MIYVNALPWLFMALVGMVIFCALVLEAWREWRVK